MDKRNNDATSSLSADGAHSLLELRSGQTATVHSLRGGSGFRSRLAALGFTPGTGLKMMQNLGYGPVIVTVRDTRIALGRGEAFKVWVN